MIDRSRGGLLIWPARVARGVARRLRTVVDCTLHSVHRRTARQRLRDRGNIRSILVICHGNICRSPYGEAALRRPDLLRDRDIDVRSAGFIGPGRPSPAEAQAAAERRGLDLSRHESRLMEDAELRETDLLVVMDPRQRRELERRTGRPRSDILILGDLDPAPFAHRAIRDPWGQPEPVFDAVYERIDRCVVELARELNDTR